MAASALRAASVRVAPASALKRLRVGGVPEHFNTPWHTAHSSGSFAASGIDLEWTEFAGGTGAMTKALREGSVDVALALTEGLVADLHLPGAPYTLLGTYVSTPLTWGVHVSAASALTSMADLDDATYAVSRMGSGSHLMAMVDRHARGLDAASTRLEVVGDLAGARDALREGKADAFMWEKFTTKHLVDAGEWRRVGEVPTPWPCFSVAASHEALHSSGPELLEMLRVVGGEASAMVARPDACAVIGGMYDCTEADVFEWLKSVRWSCAPVVSHGTLSHVMASLVEAGVLSADQLLPPSALVSDLTSDGDPNATAVGVHAR